ncbi:glycosyltransferase family 4 protein [Nocardiopsis sp. EMB25]|uniref:glycosyltransferase family 4 protein n=1 Tax=Nocardiopsis sp. EMB25 TaxID=2835867 RepID=UPI002284F559|nr:glycosyltransferase family 4 protein [Nocardiopsis sp. EMB25]MCY9783457.1 glycosyltransferase family 4 protein [Nocardiopsis sp. EMB25]
MTVAFVVPPPGVPSGGNTYNARIAAELGALGRPVRRIEVPGSWPRPGPADREGLGRELARLPDGAGVLMDGLVACGVPEVLSPHADRLRIVTLVHLPLADETGLSPGVAADLDARERAVLGMTGVVATSRWAARRLADHHGLARVHHVAPGTDPAPLAPGADGVSRLLCVASVTPRKGHDLLLDALSRLDEPTWECVCVGPVGRGAYADRVRALAEASGARLSGALTGADLESAYAAADLVVLPSRAETFGMAVTEALARGVPVVAARVGGVPEALGRGPGGDRPGILVDPEDADALGEALRRWLTDPRLRERLRTSARRRRSQLAGWRETARAMGAVLDREGCR